MGVEALDLLVVVDVVPSELAGWADVVLPESVYLERFDDLDVEWFREPDSQFIGPISMGMALSIPIWIAAALLFWVAWRKPTKA